jgi:hypothetical protein
LDPTALKGEFDRMALEGYHNKLGQAADVLQQEAFAIQHARDALDWEKAVAHIRDQAPDCIFNDGELKAFVAAEYAENPDFRTAVDLRYRYPNIYQSALHYVANYAKERSAPRYDADVSETKDSIVSLMTRGERGPKPAPAFPHRTLSSMDNKSFKRELEKLGVDPASTRID